MLNSTSAFSPKGNGLYLGQNYGGYSGVGNTGSLFGGYGTSSRITSRVASYLRTEYANTIEKAQRNLANGEFDKAMSNIESLREHAKEYAAELGGTIDDEQISTALNKAGADFEGYVDENSKGSFATGLFNGIPLVGLFFESYSKNEIQAKLGNDDVRLSDTLKESAGKVISGAGVGAAVGSIIAPGVGTLIGAIAGTALAFGQNMVKDWVNAQ